MNEKLREIDLQIMQVRYQLMTFRSFVSPSDIEDGYTVESLKERLRNLERSRRLLSNS